LALYFAPLRVSIALVIAALAIAARAIAARAIAALAQPGATVTHR